jgi:hypothetical protein
MREYRATMTINVFIKAESEEDAQNKFEELDIRFQTDNGVLCDNDLIDWEIVEVID